MEVQLPKRPGNQAQEHEKFDKNLNSVDLQHFLLFLEDK